MPENPGRWPPHAPCRISDTPCRSFDSHHSQRAKDAQFIGLQSLARVLLTLRGMYHQVARTQSGLLFHTWEEAQALWTRMLPVLQGAQAACLMPNHIHLLHPQDQRTRVAQILAGHLRSVNRKRTPIRLEPLPRPKHSETAQKRRREARYIYLNPCRAGLVNDPLAWPWSNYRDALGLSLRPLRRPDADPHRLHAYVSGDPSVQVGGTDLPTVGGQPSLMDLQAACSELLRTPLYELHQRGPARTLWMQALQSIGGLSPIETASLVGVNPTTIRRLRPASPRSLELVERLAGDERFPGILAGPGYWVLRSSWNARQRPD